MYATSICWVCVCDYAVFYVWQCKYTDVGKSIENQQYGTVELLNQLNTQYVTVQVNESPTNALTQWPFCGYFHFLIW